MAIDNNAPFRSWGSSVTFAELEPSTNGGKPRRLVLVGSGQPFMGAEWAVSNNVVTTWYPGNSVEGSQQVLGPRELPSSWEGEWKRTLLSRTPAVYADETGKESKIISPHLLREIVEDFVRTGIRLRVTWAVLGSQRIGTFAKDDVLVDVKIVREGRIQTFKTPIDRHTDIRWSMELHWVSRGGTGDKVAAIRTQDDLSQVASALDATLAIIEDLANAKIVSIKSTVKKSASFLTLGQLENIANAPLAAVNQFLGGLRANVGKLKKIGDIVKTLRKQPFAIANSITDFAHNTTSIANNFLDAMGRQPPEQRAFKSKVSALLRATNHFGHIEDQTVLTARAGHTLQTSVAALDVTPPNRGTTPASAKAHNKPGDLLAMHVVHDGDTPGRISMKYYGSADHGVDILRANKLPWMLATFKRGQILIIPALRNSSSETP